MIRGLQSIGHIAIRVKEMERSLDFYCNKLGLPEIHRLYRENGDLWLCYIRLNDDQIIELFPDGETEGAAPREATGLNHISFTVADLDEAAEDLAAAGVPLTSPVKAGADGTRGTWIEDPDGNRFELMEMHPNCIQYKALRRWKAAGGTTA
jgi:lactoylglutathione lyase